MKMNIEATRKFFVNGHQLPELYNIEEVIIKHQAKAKVKLCSQTGKTPGTLTRAIIQIKLLKMKRFKQLGKNLSRDEQKLVVGGNILPPAEDDKKYCSGYCSGSTGSWTYTSPTGVSRESCSADIQTYCRSGAGGCTACAS